MRQSSQPNNLDNKISRRRFLQYSGAALAAPPLLRSTEKFSGYLPPALPLADTGDIDSLTDFENLIESYTARLEMPHLGLLNDQFIIASDHRTVSFILYDLTNDKLLAALQPEALMPVASAFKCGVLMYFIDQVSPRVWSRLPIEYWNTLHLEEVPDVYQDRWSEHSNILRDLYRMIVLSDNDAVSRVLRYVARENGGGAALQMFNDWAHEVVGISQLSGLSQWEYGYATPEDALDQRYTDRVTWVDFVAYEYGNLMTARDLGLFYIWMLTEMTDQQILVCATLLNIVEDDRRANIERLAHDNRGMAFSKNGSLGLDASPAGIVITDAGIVQHRNGTTYLIVLLSIDADRAIQPLFEYTSEVINGRHNRDIQASERRMEELANTSFNYEAFLQEAYPDRVRVRRSSFNYGFVRYEGIPVYSRADEDYEVRNPVISSTRFGVHLLMQGALVRFRPVDDEWVELIPDAPNDNVRKRLADQIFVKRDDVWAISIREHADPISYFADKDIRPAQKFVIINISSRELVGVENGTVVFKTPIALSTFSTPRGSYPLYNKWFSRSMQAWAPGVPFTAFFHVDGYAIHGSPWQKWAETVTQDNIEARLSAGCVNIPNWMVHLGDYNRPMDELIFRWMGGLNRPGNDVYEFPENDYQYIRVMVVDYYDELKRYALPIKVAEAGVVWDDIFDDIVDMKPFAPDSFFTRPATDEDGGNLLTAFRRIGSVWRESR